MNGIAFVPARGGSKRLRNKSIIKLNNKPLIYYTLDALISFSKIIVASDSQEILGIAKDHYLSPETVTLPPETTSDKSTVLESMIHLVCENGLADGFDFLGKFLVTCPMRTSHHVCQAVDMLDQDVDGVVGITDYDFPPTLGLSIDPDGLLHCSDYRLPWLTGDTRSQNHTSIKRPNGAVYLRWVESFKRDKNFYKGKVRAYQMPKNQSYDIDTIEDVRFIETMMEK